jgi:hypothetical protein
MAVVNRPDNLADRFREIERRLRVLELSGRFKAPVYTADPASPQDGDIWINSTSGQLKVRIGGVTKVATLT